MAIDERLERCDLPGFLKLDDHQLLLILCVREENLKDSAKWCNEIRQHYLESNKSDLTVEEVERLQEWSGRLAMEAAGDIPQG